MPAESGLTNDDRLKAQQHVADLHAAGQLTEDQFRTLNAEIWRVDSRQELNDLFGAGAGRSAYQMVPLENRAPVQDSFDSSSTQLERALRPGEQPIAMSFGFWGATERIGRWAVGDNHVSIAVMGGTTIDLREAAFQGKNVDITCVAFWGGVDIIVPPEMQVRITGIGVMGSFGWERKHYVNPKATPDPDLPTLTVSGLALMGAVDIYRLDYGVPLEHVTN